MPQKKEAKWIEQFTNQWKCFLPKGGDKEASAAGQMLL